MGVVANAMLSQLLLAPSSSASRPRAHNASYICCDSLGGTLESLRPWTNSSGAVNACARNSGDNWSSSSRSPTGWPYLGWAAAAIQGSVLRYQVFKSLIPQMLIPAANSWGGKVSAACVRSPPYDHPQHAMRSI